MPRCNTMPSPSHQSLFSGAFDRTLLSGFPPELRTRLSQRTIGASFVSYLALSRNRRKPGDLKSSVAVGGAPFVVDSFSSRLSLTPLTDLSSLASKHRSLHLGSPYGQSTASHPHRDQAKGSRRGESSFFPCWGVVS